LNFSKKTCLYSLHEKYSAKFVPFAGYMMPVQYANFPITESSIHTRKHVSIFDVSHMLQSYIIGKDCINFIESLTTADIKGLKENQGCLSVFTNEKGGIKDDLIVTKVNNEFIYMVTNAGCIDKDLPYLLEKSAEWRIKGKDVKIRPLEGRGLVAVQGPEMSQLLKYRTSIDLADLNFMHSAVGEVCGIRDCRITRCGYTGEDGIEISVDAKYANELVEGLLSSKDVSVRLAGLGARDVLRLEAGLCLYGNDIDENTTPVEAGLLFVIAKRRRQQKGFPGADVILSQMEKKNVAKKRVGLISDSYNRAPRSHIPVIDPVSKTTVGFVTSGCPSPSLKKNIAMAYVDSQDATIGRNLAADFGSKLVPVTITKMPFIPTTYYTKK
uniref:Aminomethyltransferase n=1 Tax=Dracunculus medinensis TaxID=318479 RepID=A0A0N4UI11_DRAME